MKRGRLIAIDGVDAGAVRAAAKAALAGLGPAPSGGVSYWDASGVFHELALASGDASPRTLLLLYAADLAFRVRWEIAPALAEGRMVVAASYLATALAFGRAVGVPAAWLSNLFQFAPRATETRLVAMPRGGPHGDGLVDVAANRWAEKAGVGRKALTREMARYLRPRHARR